VRTRSRVVETPFGNPQSQTIDITYTNPDIPPTHVGSTFDIVGSYIERDEEISDIIALRPQIYIDPTTGSWKRFKYPSSKVSKVFKPSHPCTHRKTILRPEMDISLAFGSIADAGSPSNERYNLFTDRYFDGACYTSNQLSSPLHDTFNGSDVNYTADEYRKHDWFALADSFSESCDQFIHSSFTLGRIWLKAISSERPY